MKTKLNPVEVSFYQNSSMLAKQIKHIFTLLSCREQSILNNLDRIKHTELLKIIHISYGYGSTRRFNEDESKTIEINDAFFDTLKKELFQFAMNETTISQEIMNEIWQTLLMSIKYKNNANNAKKSTYSKMSTRANYLNKMDKQNCFFDLFRVRNIQGSSSICLRLNYLLQNLKKSVYQRNLDSKFLPRPI